MHKQVEYQPKKVRSNLQPTIDLKVTLLRNAADYNGKPLYPSHNIPAINGLGFTGFLHKLAQETVEKFFKQAIMQCWWLRGYLF